MLFLTPVFDLHTTAVDPPYYLHQPSPRGRYLTALAEARAAGITYANSLAREEALALAARQEAIRRQNTLHGYDAPYRLITRQCPACAEAEAERRVALRRAAREQEARHQDWQHLAFLRRQHSQEIRAQQARTPPERQRNDVEWFLSLLSGRPASPRAAVEVHPPSQPQTRPSRFPTYSVNGVPEDLDRLESPLMSALKPQPKEGNDQTSNASIVDKGKGKQVTPGVPPATTAPTSKDVFASLETVRNIDAVYRALSSEFEFPCELDFNSAPSTPPLIDVSISSHIERELKMAYTSRNTPVRYYENALVALLTQLDAIESFGNEGVRLERNKVVAKVEGALEDLERDIEERLEEFKRKLRREASHTLTSMLSSAPLSPLDSVAGPKINTFLLPASRPPSPSQISQGTEDGSDELVVVDHEEHRHDRTLDRY